MIQIPRTLFAILVAGLTFVSFAGTETRFNVFDDVGRVVGIGKVEVGSGVTEAEVDLLRGFDGFVSVLVPGVDGVNVAYDGVIDADGAMTVIVDGAFLDLRAFLALFGDDPRVDLAFEDRFDDANAASAGDDDAASDDSGDDVGDDQGGDDGVGSDDSGDDVGDDHGGDDGVGSDDSGDDVGDDHGGDDGVGSDDSGDDVGDDHGGDDGVGSDDSGDDVGDHGQDDD